MRERENCIQDRTRYVQRMEKALVQMNLMFVNVVIDVTGKMGLVIIKAIVDCERNAKCLAKLRDGRCKRSEEEIEKSLKGIYKEYQLFLLKQNMHKFEFTNEQIAELDLKIEELLLTFPQVPKKNSR